MALAQVATISLFLAAGGDVGAAVASPAFVATSLLTLLASFLLQLALGCLYARLGAAIGAPRLAGFVVALPGTLLLAGDFWFEAFAAPWLAVPPLPALAVPPSGRLLFGANASFARVAAVWVLFGLACLRAPGVPRAAVLPLVAGGVPGHAAASPPAEVLLALAVARIGDALVRVDRGTGDVAAPRSPA